MTEKPKRQYFFSQAHKAKIGARQAVKEKEKVSRSQVLGKIQPGDPPFLHFEVRRGFESIDPMEFLE